MMTHEIEEPAITSERLAMAAKAAAKPRLSEGEWRRVATELLARRAEEAPAPEETSTVLAHYVHPFAAAVRAEIATILNAPAFGIAELGRIGRLVPPALTALQAIEDPSVADFMKRRTTLTPIASYGLNSVDADSNGPYLSMPGTENYGAKMLREVIESSKLLVSKTPTPAQQVAAIRDAREAGMDDVADELAHQLREQLGLSNGQEKEST